MAVKADITIDIDKQIGELQNLTQIYNARVGDNKTPLTIAWRKNDLPLNLKGLHAYIVGKTGDGSYNSETGKIDFPINTPVSQFEDDGSGTLDGGQSGLTTLLIPKQMWQKSGIFAGYIGLKSEDGSVFTSKDIWFKVLGNVLDAGVEINYFIGDFNKALAEAEKKLQDKEASFDQATANALQDLHDKYLQKVQQSEDGLNNTNAAIENDLAALKKLVASVGALQAQIDANNLETQAGHFADIVNIKRDFDQKLSNIKHPTQAFDSFNQLQAQYPNGADGDFVTTDTGHIYIYSWAENNWKDCGAYQGTVVASNSVDGSKIKRRERVTVGAWSSPLIVDFKNGNLIVPDGYYKLISYPDVYNLVSGTVPIITENAKANIAQQISSAATQAEKDQLAKKDLRAKSGGLFVALDPNGVNKLETQFKFYDNQNDIPQDEVYLGFIQWPNISSFVFPSISSDDAWYGNETPHADLINKNNVPRYDDYLFTTEPWIFDWENAAITIPGYAGYQYKGLWYVIKQDTYKINLQSDVYGYFIYIELDASGKWILTFDTSSTKSTNTKILLGWIELDSKTFDIPSMPLGNYIKPQAKFYGSSYPEMDWDNEVIHFPTYWHILINNRDYGNADPFDVSFKGITSGYFVIDESIKSTKIQDLIQVSTSLNANNGYTYNLGFFDTVTKTYDLYGLNNDRIDSLQLSAFPWKNKAITCLGDSITQGDSGEGGLIPSYVPRMQSLLQTMPTNAGLGGSKITPMSDDKGSSFVGRMGSIKDQDVVTIFGGINDFQWDAPLGKMSDSTDNPTTFYGALKDIVTTLSKNNPKAKLMFITPMKTTKFQYHTFDENGELMKNANGNTQLDFVNAIKQVADYYSIPVLDMYSCSNYSPYLPSQVDNFTADGLHPTAHGYERIAQTIAKAINNL